MQGVDTADHIATKQNPVNFKWLSQKSFRIQMKMKYDISTPKYWGFVCKPSL